MRPEAELRAIADEIINRVSGQCVLSLEGLLEERDDLTSEEAVWIARAFDDEVFECSTCNWYVERGDEAECGGVCVDCDPPDDED